MYLTETPAILTYISQIFPDAALVPDNAIDFARLQSFNSFMCSTVHIAHLHRMRGHRWVDDEAAIVSMQRKVPQTMRTCFEMIESSWLQGPWVLGSSYSVCDPYLFTVSGWLEGDGVDIRSFPRVNDHFQRIGERPSVKRALERAQKATS
jgi:glutathione S-transferase